MTRPVVIVVIVLMALAAQPAPAACQLADPPAKTFDVEAGSTTDSLTSNRGIWDEQYFTVATRDGPAHAAYASVTSDRRFSLTDTTYEGGSYFLLAPKLMFDAIASFSSTHQVLPDSTLEGGLDLRAGNGYGYQATYAQRNYPTAVAGIATVGADRYRGDQHYALTLTAVHLSNVPGTAIFAGVSYARYLRCDDLSFAVSGGRDAENTGIGANVALYQTISYTANDRHWFTPHTALAFGAGWYLLTGAYDRFELHVALRERL